MWLIFFPFYFEMGLCICLPPLTGATDCYTNFVAGDYTMKISYLLGGRLKYLKAEV